MERNGKMDILALDFGGTSVKYAVVNSQGSLLRVGKKDAPLDSKEQFVQRAVEIYRDFGGGTEGIGVSIPGYVDTVSGILVGSGAYRSLYGCNIRKLLGESIPVPIAVENDGKCGALAEVWKGALAECQDGVVMILGSGIAGGIIKDGKVHKGRNFTAGEFSNFLTDPCDPSFFGLAVMNCAAFGLTYKLCKKKNLAFECQDYSAELKGLDAGFQDRYPKSSEPKKQVRADGRQIVKWLEEGDADTIEVYKDFIRSLAVLIFNVQIIYAPEKVVIGGGLSRLPAIIQDLEKALADLYQRIGIGSELRAQVVKSCFLDECNMIGAAYHYLLSEKYR